MSIPLEELRERLSEIPRDKKIYIYCAVGLRGYLAVRILTGRGFENVWNLSGGYKTYSAAMAPVSSSSSGDRVPAVSVHEPEAGKSVSKVLKIDACGLQCPGPVMKVKQAMESMTEGERVEIVATDAGFSRDAQAWCKSTGNLLVSNTEERG